MSIGSFLEVLRTQSQLSNFMLGIFLFLLLLSASILWVSLCMAVYRTLKQYAEAKQQRQRRQLLESAIQRAMMHEREHSCAAAANLSIFSTSAQMADSIFGKLPSYDEALRMDGQHKYERRSNNSSSYRSSLTNRPLCTIHNKLLRLAPQRPSAKKPAVEQEQSSVQIDDQQEHWEQCRVLGQEELQRHPTSSVPPISPSYAATTIIEVHDVNDVSI